MKKVLHISIFLFTSSFYSIAFSQPITFEKYYDHGAGEWGSSVKQTFDGGYIVAGTQWLGIGVSKIILQKVDSVGQTQWTKFLGGVYDNEGWSVKQTVDSGYIVTGYTSDASYIHFIFLVKTDKNGNTQWTKSNISPTVPTFPGGPGTGYGRDVIQTINNEFLIVANYIDDTTRITLLIKTDTNGDTLWTKKQRSIFGHIGSSLKQTSDSGFIIAGRITLTYPVATFGTYLIKTDTNGDTLWTKTIKSSPDDCGAYSVVQTTDGGYFMCGYKYYLGPLSADMYIIKTNSVGDTLWTKAFGGINGEDGWGGGWQTNDGGFIMAGLTTSFGAGGTDVYLVKTDNAGNLLWYKTFGGINSDQANSIALTSDGGFIIAGQEGSFGNQSGNVYLIKTDSNGYAPTGITFYDNFQSGILVYPNPAHTSCTIKIMTDNPSSYSFVLFDQLGRTVRTENISADFEMQRENLLAGMYFYTIIDANDAKNSWKGKLLIE